jgi:hypothetical protein
MADTNIDETSIKKTVARRAAELGGRISHRDVTLAFMNGEVAPGCRVFRASWSAGRVAGAVTGLLRDDDAPDTYPAQALGKVFRRWLETEGELPDPVRVAAVSAFLYDADRVHEVILTEEDRARFITRPEWLPYVALPTHLEASGQPGVAFWWTSRSGASQVRLYLTKGESVRSEETFVQDLVGR